MYTNLSALLDAPFISEEAKKEIREVLAKLQSGASAVANKVMKFISKLATGKQTINLIEFYKSGNKKQPLWLSDNFQQLL